MRLLRYEWGKLARLPALWSALVLCLAFNCLLIGSGDRWRWEWNETAAMTGGLGQRVDQDFLDGLGQQPQSEYWDYLLSAAEGMTDVYADYDLKSLSDFYNSYVKSSPTAAVLMECKYERLAERIAHLSETGAAMDWYSGPITHYVHQFLYGTLMRAVLTEGAVLGMLSMLFLLGYENQQRTAAGVYASRTGRKLCRWKVLAGITWALAVYLLLAAICGTLMRNVYLSALLLALLLCGSAAAQALCSQAGLWMRYALLTFQRVSIWLTINGWFTELGLNSFLPWQETISTGLGLAVCGLGTALALRHFG